jgi:hypothetical protein
MAKHWTPTPDGFNPDALAALAEPDSREEEDCPSGAICEWACDQHTTEPPMTAEHLGAERYAGIAVAEVGEDGDHVVAFGHIHPLDMARAVTAYDVDMLGDLDASPTQAKDVKHVWAALTQGGDWITWKDVTEATSNAFPLTVVTR